MKRFTWNRPLEDAVECVWDSDENDIASVPGESRQVDEKKGKRARKRHEKASLEDNGISVSHNSRAIKRKKRKPAKWNRPQKGALECGWDSDSIFDE